MGACPGYCCAAFKLTHTLDEVEDAVREGRVSSEDEKIAGMLVPLTADQATVRLEEFGAPFAARERKGESWFTCIHWDEHTRLCAIYDDRPRMCRDYPYERQGECTHGCGLKAACNGGQ